VIPWKQIDTAPVPGSDEELQLYKRGEEYSFRLGTAELMNSRATGSEAALAELACARIAGRARPRVLIGGLGLGYTAAAALQHLGARSQVTVAELVPSVVEWVRGPLADLAGRPLDDPRVTVQETDVAEIIGAEEQAWDAILLDVDNGPQALTRGTNDRLYSREGLKTAFAALRPQGVLAVWSAEADRAFTRRLGKAGFQVEEARVRARGPSRGAHHLIWLAARPS